MSHSPFNITSIELQVGYHIIIAWSKYGNGDKLECLEWRNLHHEQMFKWSWYFTYRAALLQVKYPKAHIDHRWGMSKAEGNVLQEKLKNRIIAKKRKITEYKTKLRLAEENWDDLFPIQDTASYKQAVEKIARLEKELIEIQNMQDL